MVKTYVINSKSIKFKPHKFEGKLSLEEYEKQIYSSLSKIGVSKEFVNIIYSNDFQADFVEVCWIINNNNFLFRCDSQESNVLNLGSLSQAIQEDIRQVTRGIKDLFQIMSQYEVKEERKPKKLGLLGFASSDDNLISNNSNNYSNTSNNLDENLNNNKNSLNSINCVNSLFPVDENKIDFVDENEELNENYYYLMGYSKDQLDSIYFRLKQQCILQNKPNHEMLVALKIVRNKKGFEL